ncbi:MAG: DUF839 domain-containing protein [Gemmatimonadetes bacterium]|nr:DUF839 domain-containing protein [Gemmatimonadota bacterium]
MQNLRTRSVMLLAGLLTPVLAGATDFDTTSPAMMRGDTPATGNGWSSDPLFTAGETIDGYQPVGVLDGLGALPMSWRVLRIFANHELGESAGKTYELANGLVLTGARVSYFDVDRITRRICGAGPAYDTIYDRAGNVVTTAAQLHEGQAGGDPLTAGLNRLCAANFFRAGQFGLVDDIFFTGEETSNGQEFALDARHGELWCAPALGRAAWESVTMIDAPSPDQVALLVGDDTSGSYLWLYVGQKNAIGNGSFLDRNGLAVGDLFAWVSDAGDADPQSFHGTGTSRQGHFAAVTNYEPAMAGMPGWDALGYADQSNLLAQAAAAGAFRFSRPEDVATNPADGTQVALASTGRGSTFPADNWGTLYVVDVDWVVPARGGAATASISVLYDGDDAGAGQFSDPDWGLRSPDNLTWAESGLIYAQEDRSTTPSSLFGGVSGVEASLWQVNPIDGQLRRIGEIDRSAVPAGQSDGAIGDIGNWETSGVLDVTRYFKHLPGQTVLVADVQAHSVGGGAIDTDDLVEGAQLFLISSSGQPFPETELADGAARRDVSGDLALSVRSASAGSTEIHFALPYDGNVSARIFDVAGREVANLLDGMLPAGPNTVSWNRRNDAGRTVPSGVYFARISTGHASEQAKVVVVR